MHEPCHPRGDPRGPTSPRVLQLARILLGPPGCSPRGSRLAWELQGPRGEIPVGRVSPGGHSDRPRGKLGSSRGVPGEGREISIYFIHLQIRNISQDRLLEQIGPQAP